MISPHMTAVSSVNFVVGSGADPALRNSLAFTPSVRKMYSWQPRRLPTNPVNYSKTSIGAFAFAKSAVRSHVELVHHSLLGVSNLLGSKGNQTLALAFYGS